MKQLKERYHLACFYFESLTEQIILSLSVSLLPEPATSLRTTLILEKRNYLSCGEATRKKGEERYRQTQSRLVHLLLLLCVCKPRRPEVLWSSRWKPTCLCILLLLCVWCKNVLQIESVVHLTPFALLCVSMYIVWFVYAWVPLCVCLCNNEMVLMIIVLCVWVCVCMCISPAV